MSEDSDPIPDSDVSPDELGEDAVLSPEELDVTERDEVADIGDGRFVVSTEAGQPPSPRSSPPADVDGPPSPAETVVPPADGDALAAVYERYATVIAAKTDCGVAKEEFASNNIVDAFEHTLRWYASRIDPEESPEDVLRVLLSESDLDV